jgi:hypothetical protein
LDLSKFGACLNGGTLARVRQEASDARSIGVTGTPTFLLGVAILRETRLPAFQRVCRGEGFWKLQLRAGLRNAAKQVLGNSLYNRSRALLLR